MEKKTNKFLDRKDIAGLCIIGVLLLTIIGLFIYLFISLNNLTELPQTTYNGLKWNNRFGFETLADYKIANNWALVYGVLIIILSLCYINLSAIHRNDSKKIDEHFNTLLREKINTNASKEELEDLIHTAEAIGVDYDTDIKKFIEKYNETK